MDKEMRYPGRVVEDWIKITGDSKWYSLVTFPSFVLAFGLMLFFDWLGFKPKKKREV